MTPWITFAVVALVVWRVAYAIHTARGSRSLISKWTDPWMF